MTVADVMAIGDDAVIAALEGAVPPARRRCATLPAETLRQALQPFVPLSIVSPIVLAAGAGRRFCGDKMLAVVDGLPLVRVVATAYAELCGRVTVVVGTDRRLRDALAGIPAEIVVNDQANEGIASSIRAGVAANAGEKAVMVALGDEPRVDRELVATVMRTWFTTLAPIVLPRYNGEPGHPVLFTSAVYPDLLALTGDRGAKGLIERLGTSVVPVDVAGPRPLDIDTTNDLEKL
jgi:molybdenum cofactor cytidylyltransferase